MVHPMVINGDVRLISGSRVSTCSGLEIRLAELGIGRIESTNLIRFRKKSRIVHSAPSESRAD